MTLDKRIFDLFFSLLGIILLLPLFAVIAILIKVSSPGSIFFRQTRVGFKGKDFLIYKFRTMITTQDADAPEITVSGDSRITPIGQVLRKFKLDELPQLINVFKGEMSLVGPRPEVPKYVALYTLEQRRVLDVLPGITDLASIEFADEERLLASATDFQKLYIDEVIPKKLELNLKYISKVSLSQDISIILRTIHLILTGPKK